MSRLCLLAHSGVQVSQAAWGTAQESPNEREQLLYFPHFSAIYIYNYVSVLVQSTSRYKLGAHQRMQGAQGAHAAAWDWVKRQPLPF